MGSWPAPAGPNAWAITLEVPVADSQERYRELTLPAAGGTVVAQYHFIYGCRLGAQKVYADGLTIPGLRFGVWAPNAQGVDGLRVDPTQAFHRDNQLHANGWGVRSANLFGQKFLREWSRTLRMVRPNVMLVAEDHTGWDAVVRVCHSRAIQNRIQHLFLS